MHRAGLFLFRQAIGFAHAAGNVVPRMQLARVFGNRIHHRDHVEDLELALFRFLDRFLAGDHHHRHAAQLRIGGGGDEIGRAGAERGDADAGLARVAAIGRGHEAGALFVAREHQLDLFGATEAVEEVEVLFAGHTEDIFAALGFEAFDEQVRCLARVGV